MKKTVGYILFALALVACGGNRQSFLMEGDFKGFNQGELYIYSDTYKKNQDWTDGRRPVPAMLDDLYTEIDLDDYICRSVMPYGLAAHLLLAEDPSTAGFCQQRYDELKAGLTRGLPAVSEDITDLYGSYGYYDQFGGWT